MTRTTHPRSPIGRQGGFMMLEVLIAFVIATLALAVIINAATGSLRASQIAERYDEATVRAQSRLAEAVTGPLTPGEREGSDGGGYRWRVRVTLAPGADSRPAGDGAGSDALYVVSIWITWRDGAWTRDVRLDTERIGQSVQTP